jgi:hypothetical protein
VVYYQFQITLSGICGTRVARKKKNIAYTAKQNAEFDRAELMLYEEVTRMPPFRRKSLVVVGTSGIARRTLKNRLVNSDPHRFGAVIPSNYLFLFITIYLFYLFLILKYKLQPLPDYLEKEKSR